MPEKIRIANIETIKCKDCIWNAGNPLGITCGQFRIKPTRVYYDSEECSKYKENPYKDDEVENEQERVYN